MDRLNFGSEQSIKRIDRIQEILRSQSLTMQEIAEQINVTKRYAQEYIHHLQDIHCVYIAEYRKDIRPNSWRHVALYRWGNNPNAKVLDRQYKAPASPDAEERRDRALALKKAKLIKPFRDWSAAWIPTRG